MAITITIGSNREKNRAATIHATTVMMRRIGKL